MTAQTMPGGLALPAAVIFGLIAFAVRAGTVLGIDAPLAGIAPGMASRAASAGMAVVLAGWVLYPSALGYRSNESYRHAWRPKRQCGSRSVDCPHALRADWSERRPAVGFPGRGRQPPPLAVQ